MYEKAYELLKGAIDIHVHSEPSFYKRSVDDFTLAQQVVNNGMGGVVIKCHEGSSVFRAELTRRFINNKAKIFGSLVLNVFNGGFNPYAVDSEIKLGAKIIYMPTISAVNHIRYYGGSGYKAQDSRKKLKEPQSGLSVIDKKGKLLDPVREIISIIAEEDVCLATGHLSNEEGLLVCEEALKQGVRKIIFTHADFETNRLTLQDQVNLAQKGVFIEKTMLCMVPGWESVTAPEMAEGIKRIGAKQCILSSDYGQVDNPPPYQGLAIFINLMLQNGISPAEIRQMIKDNPEFILGLEN